MTTLIEQSMARAQAQTARALSIYREKAAKNNGLIDLQNVMAGQGSGSAMSNLPGQQSAQNYGRFRDWVAIIIGAIARKVASQPYGAGKIINEAQAGKDAFFAHKRHRLGRLLPKAIKQRLAASRAIEPFPQHEALDLLAKPNPLQGKQEFLLMLVMNLYISGEAYWLRAKGEEGDEIWAVPTPWIRPKHEGELFSSFELRPPGVFEGTPLDKEVVNRMYFPDPMDFKRATSPIMTQLRACRIDEAIQASQEQMFDNGIFPNVIIEVGDRIGPNGESMGKDRLTGAQRRQLVKAVQEVWNSTANRGAPAIIDGLIKDIRKLHMTPQEMNWLESGEQVKKRLFQAFGISPFMVGEEIAGSYAQAYVVSQTFYDNVINPLCDAITVALNNFVTPMYVSEGAAGESLYLWLEEARADNPELELSQINALSRTGSISRNEQRAKLGFPHIDAEEGDMVGLVLTPQGAMAINQLLTSVGTGAVSQEAAIATLVTVYGIPEDKAKDMASTEYVPPPPPTIINQAPEVPKIGQEPNVKPEDDTTADGEPAKAFLKLGSIKITRGMVKAAHRREVLKLEKEAAEQLTPFFGASTHRLLRSYEAAAASRSKPRTGTTN